MTSKRSVKSSDEVELDGLVEPDEAAPDEAAPDEVELRELSRGRGAVPLSTLSLSKAI
jgi:hypothetical protein